KRPEPKKPDSSPRGGMVNPAPPPSQPTTGQATKPQYTEDDDAEQKPTKKAKAKKDSGDDGDSDGKADEETIDRDYGGRNAPAPKAVALSAPGSDAALDVMASESGGHKRWRL